MSIALLSAAQAWAHRRGESYVYIDVAADGVSGEVHIRLFDYGKALPLDTNGDGIVQPREFEHAQREALDYLDGRLRFFADGAEHTPRFGRVYAFGTLNDQWVSIAFELPTMGPPPDVIEAEYRFLYDGPVPEHRTMLLQSSSDRLGISDNESLPSLIFGRGAERQALDLRPRPRGDVLSDFLSHGVQQILTGLPHLAILAALLLPAVTLRSAAPSGPRPDPKSVGAAATVALVLFTIGLVAGAALRHIEALDMNQASTFAAVAVAAGIVAAYNWRPVSFVLHSAVAAVTGVVLGLASPYFSDRLGLDRGLAETALAGFGLGVLVSCLLVAAVVLPLLWLMRSSLVLGTAARRIGSLALAAVAIIGIAFRTGMA